MFLNEYYFVMYHFHCIITLQSTDLVLQHIKEITLALKSSVYLSKFRFVYKILFYAYIICAYLHTNSLLHMLEATVYLLYALPKTLTNERPDHCLNVHKAIVILIFTATLQLSADTQQTSTNDAVAKMQLYFSEWISFTNNGRCMFGVSDKYFIQAYAVAELKVGYLWYLELKRHC